MKKIVWIELGLFCLYLMDVLALPFSHLDFWMLTIAFLGAGAEIGFGGIILGRLSRRFQWGHVLQRG
jgi:hypothetical protein